MAEKVKKTFDERKKGFIVRGIIWALLLILSIVALIVFNKTPLHYIVYKNALPESMVQAVGSDLKEITFYSEIVEGEGKDTQAGFRVYYFEEDENGEQQKKYITDGKYESADGTKSLVSVGFNLKAEATVKLVKTAIKIVITVFAVIFAIYLIRLAYALYVKSEENKKILRQQFDEMNRRRSMRDLED